MHQYQDENINEEKYHSTLTFLYTFFICYKIIGEENSNKLSDTVYKYAHQIETDFSVDKIDECISSLKDKLPTLDSFINLFKNIGYSKRWGLYNDSKAKERCKLVLELIEQYVSKREVNMDVTIEHILPDCQSVENAQIGNLFLLEEPLNHRCEDKPLSEKFAIYDESSLMCPRDYQTVSAQGV